MGRANQPKDAPHRYELPSGTRPTAARRTADCRDDDAESKPLVTEERLNALVNNAPLVLFSLDLQGIFRTCAGRGLEIMGLCEKDLIGRSAVDVLGAVPIIEFEGRKSVWKDAIARALSGEYVRGQSEVGGTTFDVRFVPTAGQDGELAEVVGVATDAAERGATLDKLALRDRLAAFGTLATGVAHEINNPLTYVLAHVEFSARKLRAQTATGARCDEALVLQSLGHATEGLDRIRKIVRGLMSFAQGSAVEQRTLVDVRALLEASIQMAWHEIRHRARLVRVFNEVPPVEASEARLGQVFLNLLVNAAQAVPEGGADRHEVRVSTLVDDAGWVVVEVEDSGCGIAADVLPRIFDPFFTTKPSGEGMGLGLSITHGIVHELGGDIAVRSAIDRGTTFSVRLPAAKRWRHAAFRSSPSLPAPDARGRVLIIDDEALVADAMALTLRDDNDVTVMTDARVALAQLAAGAQYDVIFCDLMMPVLTGMDLYAELVRAAPSAAGRVIFVTGGAFTPRARAFLAGIGTRCLEKPVDAKVLRDLVRARRTGPAHSSDLSAADAHENAAAELRPSLRRT